MRLPRTLPLRRHKDILNHSTTSQYRIPDQRSMTPPGHRLRAHHRHPVKLRQPHQPVDLTGKLGRLHIICIPAKALIPPSQIRAVLPSRPSPTQPFSPYRPNPDLFQCSEKSLLPELRKPPRSRISPHIHQRPTPIRLQRPQKHLKLKRRVSDRHHAAPSKEKGRPGNCRTARLKSARIRGRLRYTPAWMTSSRTTSSSTFSRGVFGSATSSTSSILLA